MDPFVQRRRLSLELRRLREQAGETQQQTAAALEWSLSKVIRIETAVVTVSLADLRELLRHFRVEDAEKVDDLLAASRASRLKPWSDEYRDVLNAEFRKLLAFESSASVIREYCPQVVSGLFQTRPYAQALAVAAAAERPTLAESTGERWVEARMRRQELLLDRADPPAIELILGEAAVRQRVGDPATMIEQLRHLRDLAERPNFDLRVLPLDVGPHNGLWGPFLLHELGDVDHRETILFLESAGSDLLIKDDHDLNELFLLRFGQLAELSLQPEQSAVFINNAIRQLSN